MSNRWAQFVFIAIAILLLPTLGQADTPAPDKLVRQANEALTAGKVDNALAVYKQLAEQQPGRAELVYNQAVALYRKGNYDQAAELLGQSLKTHDKTLEAKARFNLGNCAYAEGLQLLKKKDKKAAVKQLQTAISHYRESLQANPNDADARANIELAQMLIKQLQQKPKQNKKQQQKNKQQNKKQQNKKQQDKQKQKQDQKKQNKQDQKKQDKQKQNQENKQQKKQDQQQQKKNEKNKQQKQKQQQKAQQKKQDRQDKQNQQDKQQQQEKQKQQDKQQQDKQQKQQGQLQQKKQNQPASGKPGDSKAKPGGSAAKAKPVKMDKMSPEEAAKLLQAVRDRNLRRRIEKYHAQQRTAAPVDKDW